MTQIEVEAFLQEQFIKICELAKQTNVTVGALRYYESLGLLKPKIYGWLLGHYAIRSLMFQASQQANISLIIMNLRRIYSNLIFDDKKPRFF